MNDFSKNIQLSKAALENLEIFDKSLFKAIEVACKERTCIQPCKRLRSGCRYGTRQGENQRVCTPA